MRRASGCVLFLLLTLSFAAAQAESSGDALSWLEKMAAKLDSAPFRMSYDATMKVSQMGQSVGMQMDGTMTRSDDKHMRMDLSMTMQMPGMGEMQVSMLAVADGTVMWMEMQNPMMGGKQVMKVGLDQMEKLQATGQSPMGGGGGMDPLSQVEEMSRMFDFESVEVDGGTVTLRARMTEETLAALGQAMPEGGADALGQFVLRLEESTAFPIEMRMGPETQPMMVMTFRDFEVLDADSIDPSTFTYEPPENVQVMDLETLAGGMGGP
jgi:outer membrane lipoprotein-sorting protein